MRAHIALETGQVFTGRLLGAPLAAGGEVVFHTGMTGYQEILTDPSYAGQIVVFTAAHLGNYGIHAGDNESPRVHPRAVVVRDFCRRNYHRGSEQSLDHVLRRAGVPAVSDVDTRALTIALRDGGVCRGYVGAGDPRDLVERARALPAMDEIDWVARVTRSAVEPHDRQPQAPDPCEVAVLDCGVKKSILDRLVSERCRVRIFPAATPAAALLASPTEGVFLSNGPGDPAALPGLVEMIRRTAGRRRAPVRHLPGPPTAGPRPRRPHDQAAVRPPRRQPPGAQPGHRPRRDHQPEPQLRRARREASIRRARG